MSEETIYQKTDDIAELDDLYQTLERAIQSVGQYCHLYDFPIPAWVELAQAEMALIGTAVSDLTDDDSDDIERTGDPEWDAAADEGERIREENYYKQDEDEDEF